MELQFCEDKETGIYDCPPVFDEEPEEGDFLFIMTLKRLMQCGGNKEL